MREFKPQDFLNFQEALRKEIPSLKISYKNESSLMGVLAFLAGPFNPGFQDKYVTTLGNTVYYPSRGYVADDYQKAFRVLAHEYVHMCDSRDHGFWGFQRAYMAPQIYAVIPLTVYAVFGSASSLHLLLSSYILGCSLTKSKWVMWAVLGLGVLGSLFVGWLLSGWWLLLLLGSLIPLGMPSSGRTKWELRGYTMTLAMIRWMYGSRPDPSVFQFIQRQFTGPDYFFMCWNKSYISKAVEDAYAKIEEGSLDDPAFKKVHDFLVSHDLLA